MSQPSDIISAWSDEEMVSNFSLSAFIFWLPHLVGTFLFRLSLYTCRALGRMKQKRHRILIPPYTVRPSSVTWRRGQHFQAWDGDVFLSAVLLPNINIECRGKRKRLTVSFKAKYLPSYWAKEDGCYLAMYFTLWLKKATKGIKSERTQCNQIQAISIFPGGISRFFEVCAGT